MTYDSAYSELNQILHRMQSEEIPLDDMEKYIKRANELTMFCKARLRSIEEEVQKLTDQKEE
jgi:exodeoxyribonuclease VII small subunit